ncbi:MAG: hypothetical protein QF464_22415, partial [Myxococcota bacterium]|nr:hypothetical protein [Myxococcota bacterium]
MHHTHAHVILASLVTLTLIACSGGSGLQEPAAKPDMAGPKDAAKADAWHRLDDPARLGENLVMRLEQLPLDGEAAIIPWAGSYWPTYLDSINHRWDCPSSSPDCDNLSPAEKYAKAFEVEGVEDYVSENHGIDAHDWKPSCLQQSDCDDGICAIRRGRTQGRCIPTWWGICHAWSPAAIAEPEPIRPLEVNGVTFKINDLKALATFAYNFIHTKYVSLRCEVDGGTVETDAYGNPTGADEPCKDTNPGTFHVITTNYLGLMGKSFVEDRTWDLQVWNQPVARYRITHQEDVTTARAHQLLDVTDD